ncbi:protein ALP1-like protein [Cinnamomum micranthum f. kanehirae]|uniref:Protein ALP1-like protein n=1 Tax=Cinnamomum micranthum f. kanehirae TaxID=337451 RepID=A0A3S3NQM3_9MAGN|nr:protein ALP1-like protein [Cinnamomum micranthum f. kanehirae]
MEKHVFRSLCNALKSRNLLHDSKFLLVEEQLAIFLMTISFRNRMMADRFQHLDTPPEIVNNPKYYPWFKDCVGAIDGTHVSASVPIKDQVPYTGKYYVVDSSYSSTPGYLVPYKGERYHLSQYRGRGRRPNGKKELFNYYHSSLRNVIERCFGILKAKFPILKLMLSYSLRRQRQIVIVACRLHNFIKMEMQSDRDFIHFRDEGFMVENNYGQNNGDNNMSEPLEMGTTQGRHEMARKQDEIADALFANHGGLEE